jgi:hypothetical protein
VIPARLLPKKLVLGRANDLWRSSVRKELLTVLLWEPKMKKRKKDDRPFVEQCRQLKIKSKKGFSSGMEQRENCNKITAAANLVLIGYRCDEVKLK